MGVLHRRRWHPDIPPVATAQAGELIRVECIDWTGGQIKNNDSVRGLPSLSQSSGGAE